MNSRSRSDKHALILARGAQVMTRRGYHGTGVLEIVQAAGVPKGSFYHYFASKEDFALQALDHLYRPRLQRYERALTDTRLPPTQRILDYYRDLVAHFARQPTPEYHCFIGSLSFEMAELCRPIGLRVEAILERSVTLLADCLEAAREAGEIDAEVECRSLAEFIGNAWEGALMRMKVGGRVAPLESFLGQLEQLLRHR
ncbi:TetR/AcrR family transcriptional regulator [Stutzerimonas nosocomialis]|uniref:TetR/AcrR family transcriptional regulator n=1 Tax=Stutzerimonas nosocomialis TaxID=1056496 RepID=UPI0011098F87|nr:TetR/AcrR family transcriptional regulator [Stutzerimonas nosocomialis]TLX58423.1 TetR/AcrR family transcriptional regulator [Stutzerimonas nosocomialis]